MITLVHNRKYSRDFSSAEIAAYAATSYGVLSEIIQQNTYFIEKVTNLTIRPDDFYYIITKRWKSEACARKGYIYIRKWSETHSSWTNAEIIGEVKAKIHIFNKVVLCINDFEKKCAKNRLADGDTFPVIEESENSSIDKYFIVGHQVPNGVVCNLCGHNVRESNLIKHQRTAQCVEDTKKKNLKDAGLVTTSSIHLVRMAKRGALKHEKVPVKYRWYVPKWAQDAATLYIKNNGYAGMDFEEFVKRFEPQDIK